MAELQDIFDDELELDSLLDNSQDGSPTDIVDTVDNSDTFNSIFPELDNPIKEDDLISNLLKSRGIDPDKILLIDEDEQEKEISFYDLTREEQLDILNSAPEESVPTQNTNLDETELELITHLRENNLTLDQFLESYKDSIINSVSEQEFSKYER